MKDGPNAALASLTSNIVVDPVAAAETARLRYVSDTQPGLTRKPGKRGFTYLGLDGRPVRDQDELKRIKALAIPPAWTDVWICSKANGHLQATGRDARGRKQYRYHSRWREVRDENKYERMIAFAHALPAIRAQVENDLKLPGQPRAKVLATVVKLLESTHIRVGNEEYARANKSFGLATLRNRHVKVKGPHIRFQFRGKSRVEHAIDLHDRRLARIIKRYRIYRATNCFNISMTMEPWSPSRRAMSTTTCAGLPEPNLAQKTFVHGQAPSWRQQRCAVSALARRRRNPNETSSRRSKKLPRYWVILKRFAASAIFIPP